MTFGPFIKPARPFGQRGVTGSGSPAPNTKDLPRPRVMILLDSWGTGAHMVVADRLSLALQNNGCEVTIFTNQRSSKLLGAFSSTSRDNPVIIDNVPIGHEVEYFRAAVEADKPDVILTEHFPLCDNSKPLAKTMLSCVHAAHDVARKERRDIKVVGLVRDVPSINQIDGPCQEALKEFDRLLVRGDASFYNYKKHFSPDDYKHLEDKLCYTGYILDALHATPKLKGTASGDVVVCLGGGDKSDNDGLYANIIRSIPVIERQHPLRHNTWHFFVGSERQRVALRPVIDEINQYSEMTAQYRSTGKKTAIDLHVFNQDPRGKDISSNAFASTLRHADFAICRGGLTAIEATAANVPTLVIPRKHEEKGEQDIRAIALEHSPQAQVTVLSERDAKTPIAICESLKTAFDKKRRNHQQPFNTDGATNAANSMIQIHNQIAPQSVGVSKGQTV